MHNAGNPMRIYGSIRIDAAGIRPGPPHLNASDASTTAASSLAPHDTLEISIDITDSGANVITSAIESGIARRLSSTPADDPMPELPANATGVRRILALDVLEHVLDEERWIGAVAEALAPGGELTIRVPLDGRLSWLDALNLRRYVLDITGRGNKLKEMSMKGWSRHYQPRDVQEMLEDAGLTVTGIERSGSPHHEIVQFGALVWGKATRSEAGTHLPRLGPLSTKLTIRAVKPE
jgi:hypothetical protein